MPLPPIFAITGFGGISLAVTVLVVRRVARKSHKKPDSSQQVVAIPVLDVSSSTDDLLKTESIVYNSDANSPTRTVNTETPSSIDSISARSTAVIESHQVTASLLPKSISTLSSATYDSRICVDTYAALLTNEDGNHDDDDEGNFDDAKTCSDDLESVAGIRTRENPIEHEETTATFPNTLVLVDKAPSDGGTESGTALLDGEYEQTDEFLVQPRSPILRQQILPTLFESETGIETNYEQPSYVNNSMYELDYDADIDVRIEREQDHLPSVFTESAIVSHEVGHDLQRQSAAVLILNSPGKSIRERAPLLVSAAPLASVPALEDVVTGTPIPATEIRIDGEQPETTNESQQEQDLTYQSTSDEQESSEEGSTTTDDGSDSDEDVLMNEVPSPLRETDSGENESNNVLQESNDRQNVSLPRFRQIVSDSNAPILPMVSREQSSLSSPEQTGSGSPAATRPLCKKDIEQVRAMTNIEASDDKEKENTFQSTSTSPERLSRKPWRSDRLSNVFSRKNSVRRLRIPERIRRRQRLPQKFNQKTL